MDNKYRINTNWDLNGPRYIYDVIIDLFSELNKSLKSPLMQVSKSDEEVQKILDNPAGITIEELQIINAWDITDKKLRRKVRNKLDWAYRDLSTRLNRLITYRNGMPNKSQEKNDNINDKNRELKNTMISQYEIIENLVKDYEKEGELSENKSKRKLLTYIRKVYSRALNETVENLFSMASEDTKRAEIFPFREQEVLKNKLTELQEKIFSLTQKNKQEKKRQQKESYGKLELEKKELETQLTSLRDAVNSSFAGLIDNEGKVNEGIQKDIAESLSKWEKIQQHLPISVEENNNQEIDPAQEWKEFYLQLEAKVEQVNHFVKK